METCALVKRVIRWRENFRAGTPASMRAGAPGDSIASSVGRAPCFEDIENVDPKIASERLAALGHETRLSIFRLLVQAGTEGVSAGLIGEQLRIAAPTLSFHLAHLSRV